MKHRLLTRGKIAYSGAPDKRIASNKTHGIQIVQ